MDVMVISGHLAIAPFRHCIPFDCAIQNKYFDDALTKEKMGKVWA